MPSAGSTRLTDGLWLAAHDSVNGKSQIGEWPLGVGLATGLLAELIHSGFLELRQGELFRFAAEPPNDPALRPLLVKMEAEEQRRQPARAQARAPVTARGDYDWPSQVGDARRWPVAEHDDGDGPGRPRDGVSRLLSPAQDETRHRKHGHQLGTWMSYLAYEARAEYRVIDRLSRAGLVRKEQRRRLLGGTAVRYVPYDSVASGTPANSISSAVQSRRGLDWSELMLAGLLLATGLHHHALATLSPLERSELADQLKRGLDPMSRELLRAADAAIGEAAMR